MAAASVHLADRVLPGAPVRQFVLSVPYELRLLLASNSEVLSAIIRIVMRVVLSLYRERGREMGLGQAETGAVSFVQWAGGSLNAHAHLHAIVVDGVYSREPGGAPVFHFVEPPSAAELGRMVAAIGERVCKMLRRRGLLGVADHASNESDTPDDALGGCRKVALTRYHGVLAPASSWRRPIAAASGTSSAPACEPACCGQADASAHGGRAPAAWPHKPAPLPVPKPEAQKTEPLKAQPPKPRSPTSTSQVPWAELMRKTLGINPLACPVCSATMVLLAVITKQEVIRRILTHVKVPREPAANDDAPALYYDVTGEPAPSWALGVDPDPDQRGPPAHYDRVDPPAPDE
jgi:hypothetical protein